MKSDSIFCLCFSFSSFFFLFKREKKHEVEWVGKWGMFWKKLEEGKYDQNI